MTLGDKKGGNIMKWKKILLATAIFLLSALMFGQGKKASADNKIELDNLYIENAQGGEALNSTVSLKRTGKLYFSFTDDTYGDVSITVSASDGTPVYKKSFAVVFESMAYITGELPAGNYTITITAVSYLTDFDATIYSVYHATLEYPEFSADLKRLTLTKGKSESLDIYCQPEQAQYAVRWSSKNPSIASVSQNGKVMAKRKGTTTITAYISTHLHANYQTLKWTITVKNPNPSFSKMCKKMKSFRQKSTKFSIIKKNKKAILKGMRISAATPVIKHSYAYLAYFNPYVELTKKNGKTSICLKFKCDIIYFHINRHASTGINSLAFKSSGSSVSFDYSHNTKKKKRVDGVTIVRSYAYTTLSSDKKDNFSMLSKLIKILGKKKTAMKLYNSNDNELLKAYLSSPIKNSWKKFTSNYKKLLEMY